MSFDREERELSIANGQGAAVISINRVELNEYADITLQRSTSSITTAQNSAVSGAGSMVRRNSDKISHNGEMQVLDREVK